MYDEVDECIDSIIDDDDDGVDVGFVEDFGNDFIELEVVVKMMILFELRFVYLVKYFVFIEI